MTIVPTNEAEAADAIRAAQSSRRTLSIEGGGTRLAFGRPIQTDDTLSSRGLSGITRYDPAELVFSAWAGTPVAEIEAALDKKGQMLPFEPMDHRAIYGTGGAPTIGGIAATGASGPRRIQAGAARDLLLGVRFVNGRGEVVKSGGRVMKNVTGLDLVKVNCGAHGTLGFLTEVTFKVLPKPERTLTLILEDLDDERAVKAMSAALGSPFSVSAAAHLPAGGGGERARTVLRLEHFAESITYRGRELAKVLSAFGRAHEIEDDESRALWRAIRDVEGLAQPNSDMLWRVSVPPTHAPALLARLKQAGLSFRYMLDWGGGLIWIASAESAAASTAVREALGRDGHATLMRASDGLRASLDVFQPQDAALMKLTAGIKASFDPDGILNPGRMYAGL